MKEQYIIIYGNPGDGFAFEGPYDDHDDAITAAEGRDGDWWVSQLNPPEKITDNE